MNIQELAKLPSQEFEAAIAAMTPRELQALQFEWPFWARPDQLTPPGPWIHWLALAGRGWGKTRTGAEFIRTEIEAGRAGRAALVAPTNADIRDVMVEGESGLIACCPPWNKPKYEPSKRRITWPNGAIASLYSAEEPDRLRGPQADLYWADELAAWEHLEDTWSNLQFGLRLGRHPRGIITTTPRPLPLVKRLAKLGPDVCHVTKGSTYDNRANLAGAFFTQVITAYEGTRLGRQELNGEILDDNPNSIFQAKWFDQHRVPTAPANLERIVVAIDPAVSANIDSNETGIVVAGKITIEGVPHYYIMADATVTAASPDEWARAAVKNYFAFMADKVIGETNNGGDLVASTVKNINPDVPFEKVTATRGKTKRAEPVAALCEQGRVHIVGKLAKLEDQCIEWDPTIPDSAKPTSPDRMDAFVWAVSFLSGAKGAGMTQGRAMRKTRNG